MSVKKRSFIAGLLYLSLVVFGPIALLLIPSQFDVANINLFAENHIGLLIIWILVDLIIIGIEIILSIYLYQLLKVYNKTLSIYAFIFRMAVVVVMLMNAVYLSLVVLSNGSNADLFIPRHQEGIYIWQLFFSVHVFILGVIILKYNQLRWKYLGGVLLLGSFGYLIDSVISLGDLDVQVLNILSSFLLIFITVGEIGTGIGLLMNKVVSKEIEPIND